MWFPKLLWQNPRWRRKYQNFSLKSTILFIVIIGHTICSSTGICMGRMNTRKKKTAANSLSFKNTAAVKFDRTPWLPLMIYLIFGLPYFHIATRYNVQNYYRGKFDVWSLKSEIFIYLLPSDIVLQVLHLALQFC